VIVIRVSLVTTMCAIIDACSDNKYCCVAV